jgi:uncharacterized protein YukE
MKYPRTNNAYHKSRRDNSDRIDALLAECEKMEDELVAQGKLERELDSVTEQRDRLAEALRELCETLLVKEPRDITDLLNKAGDALAAVKGGSNE